MYDNYHIAVVTGVASGIGNYIANRLIRNGVKVYGIDTIEVELPNINLFNCDITDERTIETIFQEIFSKEGRIDWLINCAGIICNKEIESLRMLSVEEWRKVIDVNLTGTFIVTKYAIPLLEKSMCGNIINFSSDKVYHPDIGVAPYIVSKAGVEMLTKIISVELLKTKIRANTIAMASTRTNFIKAYINDDTRFYSLMDEMDTKMPYGLIEPSDIFESVWFILKSPRIVGQTILIDSGMLL